MAIRPVTRASSGIGLACHGRGRRDRRGARPARPDPARRRGRARARPAPSVRRGGRRASPRPGPTSPRRRGTRSRPTRRPTGSASSATTGRPSAIARSAAASSDARRVAGAGRRDDEAVRARARSASIGVPSIATVAVTRWTRSAARVAVTWRRGPRARSRTTRSAVDAAERPAVQAPERVERERVGLRHVVGRLDRAARARRPARATELRRGGRGHGRGGGWPARRSRARSPSASRRSRRPASRRRGAGRRRTPSPRSCRCPGRRRRRRSTDPRAASRIARPQISNRAGNVKWLAGVRPWSIGTTSAISSRPGTWREERRAGEGRDVAAGDRVVAHADRARR